jgi:hypothetical protein
MLDIASYRMPFKGLIYLWYTAVVDLLFVVLAQA